MARPYGGHYLTEEQKKLAGDNLPLVWWFISKYALTKGVIQVHEIDECSGYLIWHLCMSAEAYDPDRGVKFSSYAVKGMWSGLHIYLNLRNKRINRFISTDWTMQGNDGAMSNEPEYKSKAERTIKWKDIKSLFDIITMSPLEEQIVFFTYEKKYSAKRVGDIVGLTGERIRQLKVIIIDKIKIAVKENNVSIEDFIMDDKE